MKELLLKKFKKVNKTLEVSDKKEQEKAVYLLSFLLPFIMMVAILISKHVFPFGDKCILRTDFYHQYLPFHAELNNKLRNFESLFYTFKVGLGTNFITLLAYYLASPFNIILLLVSENYVLEYITSIAVQPETERRCFVSIFGFVSAYIR